MLCTTVQGDVHGMLSYHARRRVLQAAGQYVVVSHRPQVYERAPCLVGVYSVDGDARTATAAF